MEADPNWGREVKGKKSKPNLNNSPRVKKKRKLVDINRQTEDESQDSITSSAGKLPVSNEEIGEETTSDSENEGEDLATNETDFSPEGGNDSRLRHNELLQQDTAGTKLSGQGFYSNLPDLPLELDTDKIDFDFSDSDDVVEIDPQDMYMPLQQDTADTDTGTSAKRDDSDLQDMSVQDNTADTDISAKGDNSDLRGKSLQQSTAETQLSDEGGDSDLQDANPQYNTATTNLTGKRSALYVPDLNFQPDTAEASNVIKEASEGASPVKESVCQVCNDAEAAIGVLPCRHLCLCLDCELDCTTCPVCGGPKNDYFYKGS